MKLTILLLSFLLNFNFQEPIEIYRTPAQSYTNFEIDHLGNTYIFTNEQLTKYDVYGRSLYNFANKDFGTIDFIDVSNPLRILVFYSAANKVLWLDNSLALVGSPISLNNLGLGNIDLVCNTRSRGFWCYTNTNFQLMLLDKNLNKINVTSNLNRIAKSDINPNYLKEGNGKLFLNNPESGILVFEQYGGYLETIPLKNLLDFQISKTGVYYLEKNELFHYDFKTKASSKIFSPPQKAKKILIRGNIIYLGLENEIIVLKK